MDITKQDIMEIVGGIFFAVVVILLFWLYLFATPDQFSAECEYQREHMQKGVRCEADRAGLYGADE